ncbi:MAG: hypothetical protein PHC39_04535 [Proteiniphilum sp.]|nr:hypothetical protein [Proteiniphilum sp.]
MIAKTSDSFPPEQVKEVIGQLSVATARSTDPANKLSLTSSRISILLGVMEFKCKKFIIPGLSTLLYSTIEMMVNDLKSGATIETTRNTLSTLESHIHQIVEERSSKKPLYMVDETLELLTDYNIVINCRARWKVANMRYMEGEMSYGKSNEILSDIHDALTSIELKYNLIIMPKHYSFDVNDLGIFGKQEQPT